jgi:hypothetical protein
MSLPSAGVDVEFAGCVDCPDGNDRREDDRNSGHTRFVDFAGEARFACRYSLQGSAACTHRAMSRPQPLARTLMTVLLNVDRLPLEFRQDEVWGDPQRGCVLPLGQPLHRLRMLRAADFAWYPGELFVG